MAVFEMPRLEQVRGDTWCLVFDYLRIPLFRLGGGRVVLMDSGLGAHREGLLQTLKGERMRVAAVLTSHTHIDHTSNHRALQQAHGARLYMTCFDAAVSENPAVLNAYFYGGSYRGLMAYAESMLCQADCLIMPQDQWVEVEGARFEILRLPGHAPEHLGFVTPDGVAYLADTLLSEKTLSAVHIPYSSCCELDLEAKRRAATLPYDRYILAHNGVYSDVGELSERNVQNLLEKIGIVERIADHYLSMDQIVARASAAMGMNGNSSYRIIVAESNIRAYAGYLLDHGRLVQRALDGVIEYIRADCL